MGKKYLIINGGSSSVKFTLYEIPGEIEIVNGYIEKIGLKNSSWKIKFNGQKIEKEEKIANHQEAIEKMLEILLAEKFISSLDEIVGVGHRVLHGGKYYKDSVIIDEQVENNIESLTKFGPLHHPGQLAGIRKMAEILPVVPQVAVFDTSFHQTLCEKNYLYSIPFELSMRDDIRKYGFHGTSCKYLTNVMKEKLGKENPNLIICHVGSGASITCVKEGKSYNTSMGVTPLDGIMMGTRSGNIGPSVYHQIMETENYDNEEMDKILNNESGLKGICGKSDFRDVLELKEKGHHNAKLAYEMYKDDITKYIFWYHGVLKGQVDAIVFSAGVLENVSILRKDIIKDVSAVTGIKLNEEVNNKIGGPNDLKEGIITTPDSKIPVYVIPTNEELMILRDTVKLVNELEKAHKNIR